jgi:hypothetical protein
MYPEVQRRWYPDLVANVPFTLVIDHFLNPVYESDPQLPTRHMDAIRRGIEGTLFTPYQQNLAIWNAWWNLYFAQDAYALTYHRWIHFRRFQIVCVDLYENFISYLVSTSLLELLVDAIGCLPMACLYGLLSTIGTTYFDKGTVIWSDWSEFIHPVHQNLVHECIGLLSSIVVRYFAWMTFVCIVFNISTFEPDDRVPVLTKMRRFLPYSLLLPICDILTCLWWKRTEPFLLPFLELWGCLSLADLLTLWFLDPKTRNGVAVATQGLAVSYLWYTLDNVVKPATLMLQQPLYVLPLFVWGRLVLHPQVKRSALIVPWISCTVILLAHFLTPYFIR